MGRTLKEKQDMVAELKETLNQTQLALVIDYQGLSVAEISDLRKRLRPMGAVCKVAKNTLMGVAIAENANWQSLSQFLQGTNAFLLVKDDMQGAIKAYQDFQKVSKKTGLRGGVLEGRPLSEADIKAIADLPSKEQLMAQIAGAINGVATKVAVGINEVPGSLARAIKAISEKEAA